MLTQIVPEVEVASVISHIKESSGKRIEARRRRDGISQRKLAAAIGCSPRWLREIEGGLPTSTLDDHIRCAHALGMSSAHIFLPLLFVEHNMPIPRELLLLDDLWEMERACLALLHEHQSAAAHRFALRVVPSATKD